MGESRGHGEGECCGIGVRRVLDLEEALFDNGLCEERAAVQWLRVALCSRVSMRRGRQYCNLEN